MRMGNVLRAKWMAVMDKIENPVEMMDWQIEEASKVRDELSKKIYEMERDLGNTKLRIAELGVRTQYYIERGDNETAYEYAKTKELTERKLELIRKNGDDCTETLKELDKTISDMQAKRDLIKIQMETKSLLKEGEEYTRPSVKTGDFNRIIRLAERKVDDVMVDTEFPSFEEWVKGI